MDAEIIKFTVYFCVFNHDLLLGLLVTYFVNLSLYGPCLCVRNEDYYSCFFCKTQL